MTKIVLIRFDACWNTSKRCLKKMTEGAARKLIELPLLTDTEKQLLLSEWNAIGPEASYPPLHEIFEEQVSRNADALAISFRAKNSLTQS